MKPLIELPGLLPITFIALGIAVLLMLAFPKQAGIFVLVPIGLVFIGGGAYELVRNVREFRKLNSKDEG